MPLAPVWRKGDWLYALDTGMSSDFMSGSWYLSSTNRASGIQELTTGSFRAVAKLGQFLLDRIAVIALNKNLSLFAGAARSAVSLESLA